MGLFRKISSLGTLGLIDFRSDKERIARYTKGSRKELRKQTRIMQQQSVSQAFIVAPVTVAVKARRTVKVGPYRMPLKWFIGVVTLGLFALIGLFAAEPPQETPKTGVTVTTLAR
jgi:hypothetical protein